MEMHRVEIPGEEDDGSRRYRCYHRMERLKAREFPMSEELPLHPQEIFGEKNSEIYKLKKIVEKGNADRFMDELEQLCSEKKLPLSTIFDQVTPTGDSLLHVAAYFGKAEIAELISHHSPELLTKTNIEGNTPLHVAAREGRVGVMKLILSQALLENKAQGITRLSNEYGNTALHEAVGSKHVEGVTWLIEADKCAAHSRNKSKKSPLYLAVLSSNKEIVNLLLEAPFLDDDPYPKYHGNSPLHAAIYRKNDDLLKEIMDKRSDLMYLRDDYGGTPLHYAATIGYVEGVRMLLEKSTFTALEKNTKGHFPIHLACKWDRVEVVKEFLKPKWDDCRVLYNQKSQSILHVAANNGSISVVKYLLGEMELMQSIINKKDKDGNTALHLAAKNVFPHILFYLVEKKSIDFNITNNKGYTAQDILLVNNRSPPTYRQSLAKLMLEATDAKTSEKGENDAHKKRVPPHEEWVKDRVNILMVVAALIVTVTFAAGFTVPGNVYSSDEHDPQKRGMAVLSNKLLFKGFVAMDSVAMYSAILGSFTLLWAQLGDFSYGKITWKVATFTVCFAMLLMNMVFMSALGLVMDNVTVGSANFIIFVGVISSNSLIIGFGVTRLLKPNCRMPVFFLIGKLGRKILIIPYLIERPVKEKKQKNQSSASKQAPQASTLEEAV